MKVMVYEPVLTHSDPCRCTPGQPTCVCTGHRCVLGDSLATKRRVYELESRLLAEEERRKLTGDAMQAESERARLEWLLSSIARTHGCPEGIQRRIRAEGVTQDPSDDWSPYRLRQHIRKLEGQVASLRVVAGAAKEYLSQSAVSHRRSTAIVGAVAEDTLREALADLEMTEPEVP